MGGWVFSMKQRRAEESCTAHLFPETLPHLRTGRLMHSIDMDTSRRGRQLAAALRLACLVSWIPESCRASSVPWILTLCHKVPPPADMPVSCSLFGIAMPQARCIGPACLVLRAGGVGVAGGGLAYGSLALVWGMRGVEVQQRWRWCRGRARQVGGCAFSCCGRSGGAGRSPGGTVGRCAAAGSTAGSSRHGRR